MDSRNENRSMQRRILISAWLVYFLMTTPGSYGTSVISTRMVTDHGWSESLIGMGSSIYFAFMAIFSTVSGMVESRIGYRKTMLIGAVIGVGVFATLLFGYTLVPVYLAMFGLMGVSCVMGGLTAGPGLVNAWFGDSAMLPMALLMTAGSIGGFTMPVIAQLLAARDVRLCWSFYGIMSLAAVLISIFFVRDREEPAAAGKKEPAADRDHASMRKIYTSFTFFSLTLQQLAIRAAAFGILSYIVLHAVQHDVSPLRAALLITIFNVSNMIGRLSSGIADRLHVTPRQLCIGSLFFCGTGCLLIGLSHGFAGFAAGAAIAGFGFGIGCTIKPVLAAQCFGSENFPVVNGVLESLSLLGNVLAPIVVYQAALLLGGYPAAYRVLGIFELVCLLPVLRTRFTRIKI